MRRAVARLIACAVVLIAASPLLGGAQEVASSTVLVQQDRGRPPSPLERHVTVHLTDVSLGQALRTLEALGGVRISFSSDIVPVTRQVSIDLDNGTLREAFRRVLEGTGLGVLVQAGDHLVLVKAPGDPVQGGWVTGRVTDGKTGKAIPNVSVFLEGTRWRATTGEDGAYRLLDVTAGTYTLTATRIGYAKQSQSVTVAAGQEVTADLALTAAATELEQVVVTGTMVRTEVKALPTPVSLISDSDIALQRPHTLQELFRQAVPTAVSWDVPTYPYQMPFSVRGASTFLPGGSQMKLFVDGIETANATYSSLDVNSIERIEVIRGPQAAAIYGSDAIGGVIEVFTKRGDPGLIKPKVDAQTSFGIIQTPYPDYSGVLRQMYAASMRGGGEDVSYNFGAGYTHTGDYVPSGDHSSQSNPSAYGGVTFARGIISVDVSGRYNVQNAPFERSPAVYQSGFAPVSKPFYYPYQYRNETLGARIQAAVTRWWEHSITVGLSRTTFDVAQSQPRYRTASDTLLFVDNRAEAKTQIGYTTSIHPSLAQTVSGSFTAGFDHYSYTLSEYSASANATSGNIPTGPDNFPAISRGLTNNTGYFAQVQLGFQDALFLTGGLRAEENTNFGDSLSTPVSPRVGLSYAQPLGGATLKLRASWGRAIRAPSPGAKLGQESGSSVVLANPLLAPERQSGWDAGFDAVFRAGGSLSVTYYDQTAANLIQFVTLATGSVPTYQNQNVGRVHNTGVEVEGRVSVGSMHLKGQYGYARARVEQLAPNYTGDLHVGDQTLATPKHTAGASLTFAPRKGANVAAGVAYVGRFNEYDYVAFYRCLGNTGPCAPSFRDYILGYPGFVKVNASVSREIGRLVSAFVSVDNLTSNESYELYTINPVMGRITTIGLVFHY